MYSYRRYRSRRVPPWAVAAVAAAVLLGAGQAAHAGGRPHHHAPSHAALVAIAWARHQLGKPYLWGGTGPGSFDCSGLVMEAYASAGVTIPRTSQEQYAAGVKVPASQVEPGDLAYWAGADGTTTAPGHVAIVISPRRRLVIEAYATGFPIREASWTGRHPAGFTRPSGGK